MSERSEARDRFLALARALDERAEAPGWLATQRAEGRDRFAEAGLPHPKLEAWRYTNLAPLARTPFELPAAQARVGRDEIERVAFPVFACSLHVFVDGRYDRGLSALGARSEVHLSSLSERADDAGLPRPGSLLDTKLHPMAALNGALLEDVAVLHAPRGARVEEPIHVVFVSTSDATARVRSPRLLVVAEAGSRVQLIQDHVSVGADAGLTNAVAEVQVGPNASVDLVLVQREAPEALHVSNTAARVERDGRFSSHALTLGGRLVRNDLSVELVGEGSEATLHGLFVGSGARVVDNHTLVDHAVPRCTSRELYKGILGGKSRGVFRGRVVVRPDAQQTNAEQSNPNLILSDAAEIDTRPQLEIHADDVKCSHGSAIGQLDDVALFYLRSRGIAEDEAREMLTRGFAHAVLEQLPVEALREGLDPVLDAALEAATGGVEP